MTIFRLSLRQIYFSIAFLLIGFQAFAQQTDNIGNGPTPFPNTACLTDAMRQQIRQQLRHNIDSLQKARVLPQVYERSVTSFAWPLQQAAGFGDPGFYAISNYIDHDGSGGLEEYFCGERTYNGHKGTDVFTWPFPWTKMDDDAVEVVAGAAGVIVGKADGNYSYNCSFTGSWNAVYVQHADGSVAWYGHLKDGTLTTKTVGQSVVQGEYLGVVGSSGWSTGPHLHLEVYDVNDDLIDPWEGPCNPTTPDSWWASQEPYYVSMINKISTHSQHPVMPQCYGTENPHFSNNFSPNSTVYCYAFLRDQLPGQSITFTIKRPNGTTFGTWGGTATVFYPAAYWYVSFVLPSNAPSGNWTYSFTHNSVTLNHIFVVGAPLPVELLDFQGKIRGEQNHLSWSTASETNNRRFSIERSTDGTNFDAIGEVAGAGSSNAMKSYEYFDKLRQPTSYYYRLLQEDYDGHASYSPIVYLNRRSQPSLEIAPNPVRDILQIRSVLPDNWQANIHVQLSDIHGRVLYQIDFDPNVSPTTWEWPVQHLPVGIYNLQATSEAMSEPLVQKVVKVN
jgi:murein DD-endopeptidase MepM/ murein hydrolase activator NlpD